MADAYLIGVSFKGYEKGRTRPWGRIMDIDQKGENYIVYLASNPQGYRVREESIADVQKWIDKNLIHRY
jgi:hypothetical protein